MGTFAYYGSKTPDKELVHLLDNVKVVAIDVEAVSLEDKTPVEISFTTSDLDSFNFSVCEEIPSNFPWHLLSNPEVTKVFHNSFWDMDCLDILAQQAGKQISFERVVDTLIVAHILNKSPANLEWLSSEVNLTTTPASLLMKKYNCKSMLGVPVAERVEHCCQDGQITMALWKKWESSIDSHTLSYIQTEMQLIPILFKMSKRGIKLDQEVRGRLEDRISKEVEYYKGLADGLGFNPASPQQVSYTLAKRGNFLPYNKSKKGLRTDVGVLEFCDDPVAALTINYRKSAILLNTFITPFRGKDRIYSNFHMDAVTGRISSKGSKLDDSRNLQNLPQGEVRNMLLPDSRTFTDFDYSQIELRFLAYFSQDLEMLDIYSREGDIHQETANFMGISRSGPGSSKNVNFAMIYGGTPQTLCETAKIRDVRVAKQLIESWSRKYRGAWSWIQEVQNNGLRSGKVETVFGRTISLPSPLIESEDGIRRKAVNYIIQSSAGEVMKRAIIKCKELPLSLQVYDELLIDGDVEVPSGLDHIAPVLTPISVKKLEKWE